MKSVCPIAPSSKIVWRRLRWRPEAEQRARAAAAATARASGAELRSEESAGFAAGTTAVSICAALSAVADVGATVPHVEMRGRVLEGIGLLISMRDGRANAEAALLTPAAASAAGAGMKTAGAEDVLAAVPAAHVGYIRILAAGDGGDVADAETEVAAATTDKNGTAVGAACGLAHPLRLPLLRRLKALMRAYEGTHSWHNFTTGVAPAMTSAEGKAVSASAAASRFVSKAGVQGTVLVDGVEHVVLRLVAPRFHFEQARRMFSAVVAVLRGVLPPSFLDDALRPTVVLPDSQPIPPLPAALVYLDECNYDRFESRFWFTVRPRAARFHLHAFAGRRAAEVVEKKIAAAAAAANIAAEVAAGRLKWSSRRATRKDQESGATKDAGGRSGDGGGRSNSSSSSSSSDVLLLRQRSFDSAAVTVALRSWRVEVYGAISTAAAANGAARFDEWLSETLEGAAQTLALSVAAQIE